MYFRLRSDLFRQGELKNGDVFGNVPQKTKKHLNQNKKHLYLNAVLVNVWRKPVLIKLIEKQEESMRDDELSNYRSPLPPAVMCSRLRLPFRALSAFELFYYFLLAQV